MGKLLATLMAATIGDAKQYRKGGDIAAAISLISRQLNSAQVAKTGRSVLAIAVMPMFITNRHCRYTSYLPSDWLLCATKIYGARDDQVYIVWQRNEFVHSLAERF